MTYGRPLKAKYFPCNVNALRLHGEAKSGILTDRAGVYKTGSDKYDLFDLQLSNVASFDTSGNVTTHIVIQIDLGASSYGTNFIAILNHNLNTAEGEIRLAYSASPITTAGGGTAVASPVYVLNAEAGSTYIATPSDGDSLATFGSVTARYWSIEIADDSNFSATDLFMGAIVIGESYTMPLSPDQAVNHGFSMEGVSVLTGTGGKRSSSSKWTKGNTTTAGSGNYIAFRLDTGAQQLPGRENYSFSYPVINDTDLLPSNIGAPTGNSFAVNVFGKTGWQALPMIAAIDSTSTTQGDFMFCRLDGNSYSITEQSAHVYIMSFTLEQEF